MAAEFTEDFIQYWIRLWDLKTVKNSLVQIFGNKHPPILIQEDHPEDGLNNPETNAEDPCPPTLGQWTTFLGKSVREKSQSLIDTSSENFTSNHLLNLNLITNAKSKRRTVSNKTKAVLLISLL
jgi:hypothetical protein